MDTLHPGLYFFLSAFLISSLWEDMEGDSALLVGWKSGHQIGGDSFKFERGSNLIGPAGIDWQIKFIWNGRCCRG